MFVSIRTNIYLLVKIIDYDLEKINKIKLLRILSLLDTFSLTQKK